LKDMTRTRQAFILSDLHLGPDNELCAFRDDEPLSALLDLFAREAAERPTELVLAGDVFDFLQVQGYDGFDVRRAPERLEALLRSPRTARVMAALKRIAAAPGVEVTLLCGNHDPELLLPEVRHLFEAAIGRVGSVRHADDEPLRPAEFDRLPVWGRALSSMGGEGDPGKTVWVVHGDRWDPVNAIDRDAIRDAVRLGKPVDLPTGSHLVFELLQTMKPGRPWIDTLKPEPAVFLLLLYLDFARTAAFLTTRGGLTGRLLRDRIEAFLKAGPLFGAEAAAAFSEEDLSMVLAGLLAPALAEETEIRRAQMLAELDSRLRGAFPAAPGTLASHSGLGRWLLRSWLARMRSADRSQDPGAPDGIPEAAGRFLPPGLHALVAGHTHGLRIRPDLHPVYVNSGTWLPIGRIPLGEVDDLIDQLEKGPTWPAESPRTFVRVDLDDAAPVVRLFGCDDRGQPQEIRQGEIGHA
jgi:UDP-2,3-diacylglucosamine pyrophosphatase LpxH